MDDKKQKAITKILLVNQLFKTFVAPSGFYISTKYEKNLILSHTL